MHPALWPHFKPQLGCDSNTMTSPVPGLSLLPRIIAGVGRSCQRHLRGSRWQGPYSGPILPMISLNISDVSRCGRCPCAHFMMGGMGLDAQAQRLYFPKLSRPRKFYFSLSITRDICSTGKW